MLSLNPQEQELFDSICKDPVVFAKLTGLSPKGTEEIRMAIKVYFCFGGDKLLERFTKFVDRIQEIDEDLLRGAAG